MKKILVACFVGCIFAMPLFAEDALRYNQVNLDVTVSKDVQNDVLIATLVVQEAGNNPATLANRVNLRMAELLEKAKKIDAVEAKTTTYNSHPVYRDGKIQSWQVSQQVQLTSRKFEELSRLIGEVNSLAHIQAMTFAISDSVEEAARQKLTQDAIDQFLKKGEQVTHRFGKSGFRLVTVNIGDSINQPRPSMMRTAGVEFADSISPELSAGTGKVSVIVRGTIEMQESRTFD